MGRRKKGQKKKKPGYVNSAVGGGACSGAGILAKLRAIDTILDDHAAWGKNETAVAATGKLLSLLTDLENLQPAVTPVDAVVRSPRERVVHTVIPCA
jgi:hypothetical protein